MKRFLGMAWLLAVGVFIPQNARAQEEIRVWLHPWPTPRQQAAVSLTFDDAYASHAELAMPFLEARGFRGTFYIMTDKVRQQRRYRNCAPFPLERWQEAARRGHEIGSHTVSHVALDTLDLLELQRELYVSQFILEVLFPNMPIFSLAYPYSRISPDVLKVARLLYTSGRLGNVSSDDLGYNDPARADFFRLKSRFLCSGETASQWNAAVAQASSTGTWLIETVHALDEEGYCRVRAKELAAHLDYLYQVRAEIWVAPVGQVVERLSQWRRLRLRRGVENADAIRLYLSGADLRPSWWVFAKVDDPTRWQVVDSQGREHPLWIERGYLSFAWPSEADALLLLRRSEKAEMPTPSTD